MKTLRFALLAIALLAAVPVWAQDETPATTRVAVPTLSVTGTAETRARPDLAMVTLGVETQAATLTPAIQANNTTMQAVVAAIRKAGVPERDIQTANFSVYPLYRSRPIPTGGEEQQLIGYRVSNTVSVRLEDVTKVGPVIDAGMGAGANTVQGISFMLRNDEQVRSRALAQAAQEAQGKARALAEALGVRLGSVLTVSEQGAQVRPVYMEAAFARAAGPAPTPISPGEVGVTATVSITYRIQ